MTTLLKILKRPICIGEGPDSERKFDTTLEPEYAEAITKESRLDPEEPVRRAGKVGDWNL